MCGVCLVNFTKSDLLLSRQCTKAFWLKWHEPGLAAPPSEATQMRLEQGLAVDVRSRESYGGGVFIDAADWNAAVRDTTEQIESGAHRLYQPAFEYQSMGIRVDILDVHPGGAVTIREVKMSTRLKEEHKLDLAVQTYVLQGLGFDVHQALLVLIDNTYLAPGNARLFYEEDVTALIEETVAGLGPDLQALPEALSRSAPPPVRVGRHCKKPRKCAFYEHCWQDVPAPSVHSIPRLSEAKINALLDHEIWTLDQIPEEFELTARQWEYVRFQLTGSESVDQAYIRDALAPLDYPLHFLDFETHSAPIPPYPGTKPFQAVPFQFSCHVLTRDGTLHHHEYLHPIQGDPRESVASRLAETIGTEGAILAYNAHFETAVLDYLAAVVPRFEAEFRAMVARVFDQLALARKSVKHPGLGGSYSLKKVTEVLLPEHITYEGLDIADGDSAHAAWVRMTRSEGVEKEKLYDALKAYCKQDTLAQVAFHTWCVSQIRGR